MRNARTGSERCFAKPTPATCGCSHRWPRSRPCGRTSIATSESLETCGSSCSTCQRRTRRSMALSWDRRVVPERVLEVLSRSQARVECRIAGGAALSGVHLHHRLSRDVDLFFDDKPLVRELSRQLDDVAQTSGARFRSLRDS